MAFILERYIDRLSLTDVPPGPEGLAKVQTAHMRAIPFENIDPLLGTVPSLAPEDLASKLIAGGRGGYCFEHNALFGAALDALGYTTRPVLARVHARSGQTGARSHHAFAVESDGEIWLCDTGFGGHGALVPLRRTTPGPQGAPNGTYRVRIDPRTDETTLDRQAGSAWVPLYTFDTTPVHDIDFEAANYLCARWEHAPFAANLMLAFHTDAGRVALFNRSLTRGAPPKANHSVLASQRELGHVLRDTCGLALSDDQIARVWARIEHAPTRR